MVKIRLSRGGSKKRPFYHIVATDSRNPRDGKYIERLGYYNPRARDNEEDIVIDSERLDYWKSVGAQISDRVLNLIKLTELSREDRDSKKLNKLTTIWPNGTKNVFKDLEGGLIYEVRPNGKIKKRQYER